MGLCYCIHDWKKVGSAQILFGILLHPPEECEISVCGGVPLCTGGSKRKGDFPRVHGYGETLVQLPFIMLDNVGCMHLSKRAAYCATWLHGTEKGYAGQRASEENPGNGSMQGGTLRTTQLARQVRHRRVGWCA